MYERDFKGLPSSCLKCFSRAGLLALILRLARPASYIPALWGNPVLWACRVSARALAVLPQSSSSAERLAPFRCAEGDKHLDVKSKCPRATGVHFLFNGQFLVSLQTWAGPLVCQTNQGPFCCSKFDASSPQSSVYKAYWLHYEGLVAQFIYRQDRLNLESFPLQSYFSSFVF